MNSLRPLLFVIALSAHALAFGQGFDQVFGPDPSSVLWQMGEVEVSQFRCAGIDRPSAGVLVETTILLDSLVEWRLSSSGGSVSGSARFVAPFDQIPHPVLTFTETREQLIISTLNRQFVVLYDEGLDPKRVDYESDDLQALLQPVNGTLSPTSWNFTSPEQETHKENWFRALLKDIEHFLIQCS
jgi:hypothetical protein